MVKTNVHVQIILIKYISKCFNYNISGWNKMTETTDGILRKGIICFAVFFTISLLYLTYNLSDIFTELILQIPYVI